MRVFKKKRKKGHSCGQVDRNGNKILCNKCRKKYQKLISQMAMVVLVNGGMQVG